MATPTPGTTTAPASAAVVLGGRGNPPLPSWLDGATPGHWVAVPTSTPSTSGGLAPAIAEAVGGQQLGMVNAWCGAFLWGSRLHIHGGGHGDYAGNEIGAIDLAGEAPAWDLIVERSRAADVIQGSNYYADGLPTSRHTYYGMFVTTVSGVPQMVRFNAHMGFAYGVPADVRTTAIDAFNLQANVWQPGEYGPSPAITGSETSMCQDRSTEDVYAVTPSWQVYRWHAATDVSTLVVNFGGGGTGGGGATVFDHLNGRLVRFAGRANGRCEYWDTVSNTKVAPTLIGPHAAEIAGLSGDNHGWGAAHDGQRNVAWLLTNAGNLYRVRLDDFYVERVTAAGVTPTAGANGVWGKFQYVPSMDAVAYLASWTSPVLMMRCF